jgi:hypothetical protein
LVRQGDVADDRDPCHQVRKQARPIHEAQDEAAPHQPQGRRWSRDGRPERRLTIAPPAAEDARVGPSKADRAPFCTPTYR